LSEVEGALFMAAHLPLERIAIFSVRVYGHAKLGPVCRPHLNLERKEMRKLIPAGLLLAVLIPAAAAAQSAFDGTWKVDMKTAQFPTKPDSYLLKDGEYDCSTCIPAVRVKADGLDHKVSGHPYYDSVAIKVINDRSVEEIAKRNGKVVTTATTVVSADGKTATFEYTDSSDTNGAPVTGKGEAALVKAGPAGSHAISGDWKMSKMDSVSDNSELITYKIEAESLTMSEPTGQSYVAKLDGTEAPFKGDPGLTTVSVKRIDKDTILETDKRDGKAMFVVHMTISADGKSLAFTSQDLERGTTSKITAMKQ
jgi:hypothetical protein